MFDYVLYLYVCCIFSNRVNIGKLISRFYLMYHTILL